MRAIITGQVGMNKKSYIDAVEQFAGLHGEPLSVYHVGDLMYEEAPEVRPGRILDLSLSRLKALRRSAFKDIINDSADKQNVIVNTHATFRWRHGLFRAFDFDQIEKFKPDVFICLVDNVESIFHRLHEEHDIDATFKDIMVWREEEIMATELLANAMGKGQSFYILARGRDQLTGESCYRLVCRPDYRKVYPSFPMSHVVDMPDVLEEIDTFRKALAQHFVTFDPGDVDEKLLLDKATASVTKDFIDARATQDDGSVTDIRVPVRQVLDVGGDIDGQIYMRDFKLIDQSDMIVSLVPELPGGVPGLSSGVERELHHAFEHGKEVYLVWKPKKNPSPFITETATKVFKSVPEALQYFETKGMFCADGLFSG